MCSYSAYMNNSYFVADGVMLFYRQRSTMFSITVFCVTHIGSLRIYYSSFVA